MTKDERFRYYASREWAVLKEAVKARSGGKCERCRVAEHEATHHLTYERFGSEKLEDLQGVCGPCHEFLSGKSTEDPALNYLAGHLHRIRIYALRQVDFWFDTVSEPSSSSTADVLQTSIEYIVEHYFFGVPEGESWVWGCDYKYGALPSVHGTTLWCGRLAYSTTNVRQRIAAIASPEELPWMGYPFGELVVEDLGEGDLKITDVLKQRATAER